MPNTASSWKNMMQMQRARAVVNKNNARVAEINAALAANAAKVAAAAVVSVAPLVAAPAAPVVTHAGPGLNLSGFSPNDLAYLGEVAKFSRGRGKTELEGSYSALNAAEKLGKKRRSRRRRQTRKRT